MSTLVIWPAALQIAKSSFLKTIALLIAGFTSVLSSICAQDIFAGYEHLFTATGQYAACHTAGPIRVDGNLSELSWQRAAWSAYFTDIEGSAQPAPTFKTRFKLLWDDSAVYIAAELEEPDVWASLTTRDAIVYHDNDFEVFIDPDGDGHNYFEVEVNAFNTIFDLLLVKPYRNGGPARTRWNAKGLRSAVTVTGTINQPGDQDQKWVVEMAIPLHALKLKTSDHPSMDQAKWRVNFSRVEWDSEFINGAYTRKKSPATGRLLPEHNWVWSPQGVINMHLPERWGTVYFLNQPPGLGPFKLPQPPLTGAKELLWLLYYKQQQYKKEHREYAAKLDMINFPKRVDYGGNGFEITLEARKKHYKAVASDKAGEKWLISDDGRIVRMSPEATARGHVAQ
jgi:hypothetical protein